MTNKQSSKCVRCGHDPSELVLATWSFLIERDPPSLNKRLYNAGPGRHLYRQERDMWCWEFRAARLTRSIPKADGRRRVTLARLYGGRQQERDYDNLAGGMKAVVDAMVSEGLLTNDTPDQAEITYQQAVAKTLESRGLLVLIESVGAAA